MWILLLFPLFLGLLEAGVIRKKSNGDQLVFVNAIWRHGNRAPDVLSNSNLLSFFKYGTGQLTEEGIENSYQLGKQLASRYVATGFLNRTLNVRQVKYRSVAFERCLATAVAVGQGMFSDPKRSIPLPFPVFTEAFRRDEMLAPSWIGCPRSEEIFKGKCPTYTVQQKYNEFLAEAFMCQGWDKKSKYFHSREQAKTVEGIVNEYLAQVETRPPDEVAEARAIYQDVQAYQAGFYPHADIGLAKLHGGMLLAAVLDDFDHYKECKDINDPLCAKRFAGYSTQDFLMAATLELLDLKKTILGIESPFFSSAIVLELWRRPAGDQYVKIYYRYGPRRANFIDFTKEARGCKGLTECPFADFVTTMRPFTYSSRADECLVEKDRIVKDCDLTKTDKCT